MMKKRFLITLFILLLLSGCTRKETLSPATPAPPAEPAEEPAPVTAVVLSSLVADNRTAYRGESGLFPDYIVLRNDGSAAEKLGGYHLSQKEGKLRYALPDVTLEPGETLTVECDGWNRGLHTDFALKSSGEQVVFSDAKGRTFWSLEYPALDEDQAYVLQSDGSYSVSDVSSPMRDLPEGLRISECTPFNFSFYGIANEYYDWVELYNGGSEPVLLSDYTLSDKRDAEGAPTLPEMTLNSGEYLLLLCTGSDMPPSQYPIHPISLSGLRDALYLRGRDGTLIDYCSLHDVPIGGSYGRSGSAWVYFPEPTPLSPNGEGFGEISSPVCVDTPEGCYENVDCLCVALSGQGSIRYTLDGSEPTEESSLYTSPLILRETSVLRARCYESGKCPGAISGFSYILNEGHSLPVVSLILPEQGFFSPATPSWPGIYYLEANTIEPELLTDVSYFEGEGGFHAQSTISLHGASTRKSREKKSLKLTFRGAYGGDVHYDLFGDGVERYHSLTLRSGYMEDNSLLRDSICQSTAIETGAKVLCLRNRYCVVYINGQYWGIYSLREAYSRAYAADHLGSTEDAVQIVRSKVRPGYEPQLVELFNTLSFNRHWDQEIYDRVAEVIDLESLADWLILESYFYNYDLPGNIRYIRADRDSKFLYAFFDLDFGLRKTELDWLYSTMDEANQFGLITQPIMRFSEFQELLLTRMARLYEQGLSEETMLRYLDEYSAQLEGELEREYARWPQGAADTGKMVEELRVLIGDHRQERCFESLCRRISLDAEPVRSRYFAGRELE
ncbi:MAG: CotH kinase family protein [Oscillospiraceae bacterium]|nr:CotH kinase family protein [Oscillospiraceae bacterium]